MKYIFFRNELIMYDNYERYPSCFTDYNSNSRWFKYIAAKGEFWVIAQKQLMMKASTLLDSVLTKLTFWYSAVFLKKKVAEKRWEFLKFLQLQQKHACWRLIYSDSGPNDRNQNGWWNILLAIAPAWYHLFKPNFHSFRRSVFKSQLFLVVKWTSIKS